MLPHFLIAGAMKSGTTSLYHYLAQHPQLELSYTKEVRFFAADRKYRSNFQKGEAWYRAYFPLKINTNNQAFEASGYMSHPIAAKRIFTHNPKMKIIMLLRNPTERAISHYFPKDQILILASEELFAQPKQVLRFVGVDTEFEARDLTPWNVATNKVAVESEVRQYLNDDFLPHNQELYQLIGRDLSWE